MPQLIDLAASRGTIRVELDDVNARESAHQLRRLPQPGPLRRHACSIA